MRFNRNTFREFQNKEEAAEEQSTLKYIKSINFDTYKQIEVKSIIKK